MYLWIIETLLNYINFHFQFWIVNNSQGQDMQRKGMNLTPLCIRMTPHFIRDEDRHTTIQYNLKCLPHQPSTPSKVTIQGNRNIIGIAPLYRSPFAYLVATTTRWIIPEWSIRDTNESSSRRDYFPFLSPTQSKDLLRPPTLCYCYCPTSRYECILPLGFAISIGTK